VVRGLAEMLLSLVRHLAQVMRRSYLWKS
jgi:hypothetical protein